MKVRIFKRPDNKISIIHPAPKSRRKKETESEWLERVFEKVTPDNAIYIDIDEQYIPSDRTFRNAWEYDQGFKTNMSKAKLIAHEIRRRKREILFAPLDVEATIPDKAEVAEARRAEIRLQDAQLQIDIDNAVTESELKTLII